MTEPHDYTHHSLEGYYQRDHLLRTFWEHFADLASKRVVNVGCGRAQSLVDNPTWFGVDFNPLLPKLWNALGLSLRTTVHDLRLPLSVHWGEGTDQPAEWTVSADFLEHVKPKDLPLVAQTLKNLAPNGRHVIDQAPLSSYKALDGASLHPAAELSHNDWLDAFHLDHNSASITQIKPGFLLLQY